MDAGHLLILDHAGDLGVVLIRISRGSSAEDAESGRLIYQRELSVRDTEYQREREHKKQQFLHEDTSFFVMINRDRAAIIENKQKRIIAQ